MRTSDQPIRQNDWQVSSSLESLETKFCQLEIDEWWVEALRFFEPEWTVKFCDLALVALRRSLSFYLSLVVVNSIFFKP